MELRLVVIVARRELREALRNRWLWSFAVAFAILALAVSRAGMSSAGYASLGGFGRTAASLINAVLLFVPLIGLVVGAGALAGERERGTLLYLMAQPISRTELFWGKALGSAMAVFAALALGFALAGFGLATGGSAQASPFLGLVGNTLMLALASLGMGFAISSLTRKSSTASGVALLMWLGLVFLADLGLIGAALSLRPSPSVLLGMLLLNPLQAFKLNAIFGLRATLDSLGPVGQYAAHRFGEALPALLLGVLAAWAGLSFAAAFLRFRHRGDA